MQLVAAAALDADEKERFFAELRRSFAAVQQDPEAWRELEAERAQESAALRDGLGEAGPDPDP